MGLELHGHVKFFIQGPLCSGSLLCNKRPPNNNLLLSPLVLWVDLVQLSSSCLVSHAIPVITQLGRQSSDGSTRLDSQDGSLTWLAVDVECESGVGLRLSPRAPA